MSAPSTAKPDIKPLTYDVLKQAVETAAAFRCRRKLQPAGGPGDKVFPPTFAGAVYAIEKRRLPGRAEPVTCVLLDSVQSQANRMEQALQDAVDAGQIKLPIIQVDFSRAFKEGKLLEDPGPITSLQVPHRLADAILRDSEYKEADGKMVDFRHSSVGRPINDATPRNATAIYQLCPTALIFGMWDSTGPKGGLGAKFERAMVSEIVGVNATEGDLSRGVRRDPLEISAQAKIVELPGGDYKLAGEKEPGAVPPSKVNHSSVPFPEDRDRKTGDNRYSGVTVDYAEQTITLSLAVLRRLRFGGASAGAEVAARCVLASLGILAATLSSAEGEALRSRCLLWPDGPIAWELLEAPGVEPKRFEADAALALASVKNATERAREAGLGWRAEKIELTPGDNLAELVRKTQLQRPTAT